MDVTFSDAIDVDSLQFGSPSVYRSILDYDFITVSGQRVLVDFIFFNDMYSRNLRFYTSSADAIPASDFILNTYGIIPIPISDLSLTPMYIYDMGVYEHSSESSSELVSTQSYTDSSAAGIMDFISPFLAEDGSVKEGYEIVMNDSTGKVITSVSSSTSSGYALTSAKLQTILNSYYVFTESDSFVKSVSVDSTSENLTTVTVNRYAPSTWGDTYSIVSSISSVRVSSVDIPGGGYYIFCNPNAPTTLKFQCNSGSLNYYADTDLLFNFLIGIDTPVSDVSVSGSGISVLSYSQSSDQLLVSLSKSAVEEAGQLDLSSITLTVTFSEADYITQLLYFYVTSYDQAAALDQASRTTLLDSIRNGFSKLVFSLSSLVHSITSQTDSIERGYQDNTTQQAEQSLSEFQQSSDTYLQTEETINNQVAPYLDSYNPDSSGFLALTQSFGVVSGIITNIYNRLGSLQILFTFSMTIGICLFLLQLKK